MQEHQTNKATLQTFQPTYPYYRRPFSLTTIIWVPLGRLVPPGRFGASWSIPLSVNIPLTVGAILYTPAGRIMRDERSLVTLLLGTYCTPLLRDFWEMRDYRRFIHPCFPKCSGGSVQKNGFHLTSFPGAKTRYEITVSKTLPSEVKNSPRGG